MIVLLMNVVQRYNHVQGSVSANQIGHALL